MDSELRSCDGQVPTSYYAHFTGRSKPWIPDDGSSAGKKQRSPNIVKWFEYLDELQLPVNSSNVKSLGLGSPLGYYNTDMFKKKKQLCVVETS